MINFLIPIIASILISLLSLVGIIFLSFKKQTLEKIILYLVSLSAGTLLGGAFIHLIPESFEASVPHTGLFILLGFVIFFLIENLLSWHHCHQTVDCHHIHNLTYMNLIGDATHNFLDGLIIAAAFLTSFNLGLVTSFNIALHEIPQEIGDFGVLIHAGNTRTKAIFYNLLSATSAILGTIIGLIISQRETLAHFILPIAAGGFIYIAASDLIPEIKDSKNKLVVIIPLLLGIGLMWSLTH